MVFGGYVMSRTGAYGCRVDVVDSPGVSLMVRAELSSSVVCISLASVGGASCRRRWWPEKSLRCWVSRKRFCASWCCSSFASTEILRGKTGRQA
jgi:hypothetical protein